jgi:hypothetical protein
MKRLHVHVSVDDLTQSIRFYSTLFSTEPIVLKGDYAKWMLDDPKVNFVISTQAGRASGISHLGIQAEDESELVVGDVPDIRREHRLWRRLARQTARGD